MDELIRETLSEKAKEIEVPAGAWKQVREQIRPSIRVGLWGRFRLGARLELVATVAVLVLFVAVGTVRQAGNRGVVTTPASLTVTERAVAKQQEVGDDLLKLPFQSPVNPKSLIQSRIVTVNDMLKPFGYRLEQTPEGTFDIYHVDKLVLHGGFSNFSPVTVSERQDNFIFMVFSPADRYWLIDVNGVREWTYAEVTGHLFHPPVYVHNELVSVQSDSQSGSYAVWRDGQRVFTVPLKKPAFGNEVKRLTSWSGHWVLEVVGDVYVDGQSLSKQLGYAEVFEWRLVDGRPLYLFREGSQFGVAYDSKVLAYRYEQLPHNLCCEPASLNPLGNEGMVHFYGLRQGTWYWVEMRATGKTS